MVFLGFSIEIALLASTAAIMSSVPLKRRVQQVLLREWPMNLALVWALLYLG